MVKKVWQTDRQTDGRTDGLNQSYSCLVAAKKWSIHTIEPMSWQLWAVMAKSKMRVQVLICIKMLLQSNPCFKWKTQWWGGWVSDWVGWVSEWHNGLSPGWRQAIIWTNAGILSIGTLGTNFSEILIKILTFSLKIMHLKKSSAKWRPFVSASMS